MELAISEELLTQFDKATQAAYERFYGVQKGTQQPAQQPVQQQAIPDSVKALLPDSVKAALDSLQAVNDSINRQMENANNKKDLEYIHQAGNVLYFGRVPGAPEVPLSNNSLSNKLLSNRIITKVESLLFPFKQKLCFLPFKFSKTCFYPAANRVI